MYFHMSLRGGCPERSVAKSKDLDEAISCSAASILEPGDCFAKSARNDMGIGVITTMQTYRLGTSDLNVTRIGYGCMLIGGSWDDTPLTDSVRKAAIASVRTALDAGINFFDHADIYCNGKSEEVFADLWKDSPHLRQQIYLQTKCGIRFAPQIGRA